MSTLDPTAPEPPQPVDGFDAGTGRVLDEVAANATVAPLTRLVDGWLCKAAPGLPFRRANAVLPADGAGADEHAAGATLASIEAWYRGFGQRVLVQVSSADPTAPALDELLERRGYEIEAPVDLLVAETDAVVEAGRHAADALRVAVEEHAVAGTGPFASSGPQAPGSAPRPTVVVDEGIDEAWARRYGAVHGEDAVWRARTEAYGRMLGGLGPSILGGAVLVGDVVAGVGFVVLERGWAGVYGMGTAPAWRRMGVAGALLGALAVEARRRHGTHAYLQVELDNRAAQSRYRGLGFTGSHAYHYRVGAAP